MCDCTACRAAALLPIVKDVDDILALSEVASGMSKDPETVLRELEIRLKYRAMRYKIVACQDGNHVFEGLLASVTPKENKPYTVMIRDGYDYKTTTCEDVSCLIN